MAWYSSIIKRILKGAVLFLLPVTLMFIIIKKAAVLVGSIIKPLLDFLPEERILGIGMLSFLTLTILLFISYLAGRRAEKKDLKSYLPFFEEHILPLIPGYTLLKSSADEAVGNAKDNWKAVLVGEKGDWKFGIEVEQHEDGYSAVFFPEPPDAKSGELRLIHSSKLQRVNIPPNKLISMARKYGHGTAPLTSQLKT